MVTWFGWTMVREHLRPFYTLHLFLFYITMVLSSHSSLASEIMEDPILEMSQVLTELK